MTKATDVFVSLFILQSFSFIHNTLEITHYFILRMSLVATLPPFFLTLDSTVRQIRFLSYRPELDLSSNVCSNNHIVVNNKKMAIGPDNQTEKSPSFIQTMYCIQIESLWRVRFGFSQPCISIHLFLF